MRWYLDKGKLTLRLFPALGSSWKSGVRLKRAKPRGTDHLKNSTTPRDGKIFTFGQLEGMDRFICALIVSHVPGPRLVGSIRRLKWCNFHWILASKQHILEKIQYFFQHNNQAPQWRSFNLQSSLLVQQLPLRDQLPRRLPPQHHPALLQSLPFPPAV